MTRRAPDALLYVCCFKERHASPEHFPLRHRDPLSKQGLFTLSGCLKAVRLSVYMVAWNVCPKCHVAALYAFYTINDFISYFMWFVLIMFQFILDIPRFISNNLSNFCLFLCLGRARIYWIFPVLLANVWLLYKSYIIIAFLHVWFYFYIINIPSYLPFSLFVCKYACRILTVELLDVTF